MSSGKRVTLQDVASRIGVSVSLVSKVLNNRDSAAWVSDDTRSKVVEAALDLGYQLPSRRAAVVTPQPRPIDVAIVSHGNFASGESFGVTIAEICKGLSAVGMRAFMHLSTDRVASREDAERLEREGSAQAIVQLLSRLRLEDTYTGSLPCVVVGEAPVEAGVSFVCVDNTQGGRSVGEFLWGLGHRRVGFVINRDTPFETKRTEGLTSVWRARGHPHAERPTLRISNQTDLTENLLDLLSQSEDTEGGSLTALFCGGDGLACRTVMKLKELGYRVPGDISVVGFNDDPMLAPNLDPPLTTMRQPFATLGYIATQLLQERLQTPEAPPRHVLLPAELVVRQSAAPPPMDVIGRTAVVRGPGLALVSDVSDVQDQNGKGGG